MVLLGLKGMILKEGVGVDGFLFASTKDKIKMKIMMDEKNIVKHEGK